MHAHRYMCAIRWEIKRKLLYYYYRTGAFVSRGRTTKERAWPTIIIYIYIIMPNIHIILLHAAAAGIYLRDFDRISPSVYGGRRTQRKRMLTLLTSIVIIRKKTYQNETKIANTRDSYDRSSVTELRRREKKIILVTTQPLTCDPPPPPVNVI